MAVEVHRCLNDPGSQIPDPGGAQTTVVVQPAHVCDDPVGRVGQNVIAQGLHASLDGVVVSAPAISGEDVVDELLARDEPVGAGCELPARPR